jgi:hypothetical protein
MLHSFIAQRRIIERGIGYIDAHLLAAAVIRNVPIWTNDKRLLAIAEEEEWAFRQARTDGRVRRSAVFDHPARKRQSVAL